eukprot:6798802-Lingulodinium_polyedra.AAC.1
MQSPRRARMSARPVQRLEVRQSRSPGCCLVARGPGSPKLHGAGPASCRRLLPGWTPGFAPSRLT